jgi:aryl-alcohol dehydrogenase-like predicted oxidoreductase
MPIPRRPLGRTGLSVSPLGFGAFKIGRNEKIKYAQAYPLPSEAEAAQLLNAVVGMGINYVDTAPAYGLSEERIGRALGGRGDIVISTKVGELFENGESRYDFYGTGVRRSIRNSLARLQTDVLDMVFIHCPTQDVEVLEATDVVPVLRELRDKGTIRAIGFSGKTVAGARAALYWADAIMVEYHLNDRSHEEVIAEAGQRQVGVVVKKGLASGRLPAEEAIPFILANPHITSLVIGGLDAEHIRANLAIAERALQGANR